MRHVAPFFMFCPGPDRHPIGLPSYVSIDYIILVFVYSDLIALGDGETHV